MLTKNNLKMLLKIFKITTTIKILNKIRKMVIIINKKIQYFNHWCYMINTASCQNRDVIKKLNKERSSPTKIQLNRIQLNLVGNVLAVYRYLTNYSPIKGCSKQALLSDRLEQCNKDLANLNGSRHARYFFQASLDKSSHFKTASLQAKTPRNKIQTLLRLVKRFITTRYGQIKHCLCNEFRSPPLDRN